MWSHKKLAGSLSKGFLQKKQYVDSTYQVHAQRTFCSSSYHQQLQLEHAGLSLALPNNMDLFFLVCYFFFEKEYGRFIEHVVVFCYCMINKETLRPILQRTTWSLNIALQMARPTVQSALEAGWRLNRKAQASAGMSLPMMFGLTEMRGDWQWHIYFFSMWNHYWKCGAICWRCNAARIPR